MSKPLRLEFSGALYHVTSRGNERKAIFRDEQDFAIFMDILASEQLLSDPVCFSTVSRAVAKCME